MRGKWPALLLAAAGLGGAAVWRLTRPPVSPSGTPVAAGPAWAAKDTATPPEAPASPPEAPASAFADRLTAAKESWKNGRDPVRAERLLQEALALARTDEQRFAACEWRAELFDGRDNARQHAAGQAMRAAAHGPRQQAAAFHVMGRASEKTGDYRAAIAEYETAAGHYRSAGQPDMARLDFAAAARLAVEHLHDSPRGNDLWRRAWQAAESAATDGPERAAAFYDLCLDQAAFAAGRKEYAEELRWHREAARWQPSHEACAAALEAAYRRQRKL